MTLNDATRGLTVATVRMMLNAIGTGPEFAYPDAATFFAETINVVKRRRLN